MGKSSPKAPAAPDPSATAAAQTQTNKETAYWNAVLNNVNQNTPYGSLSYQQTGGGKQYNMDGYNTAMDSWNKALAGGAATTQQIDRNKWLSNGSLNPNFNKPIAGAATAGAMPKLEDFYIGESPPQFTSTIKLSPEQQAIYDAQTKQQQELLALGGDQISRIRQNASTPFSFDGLGNEIKAEDIAQARASAEEAIMSRLNPQFGRDEESLRTRLINQGITQGSEAYNNEFNSFGQNKNDARMQAILAANQYGGDLQNQALQRRNQAIQEYTTQRNAPLNEYIGFTSGTQVQNPQFSSQGYGGAAPVDYANLVNNQYQGQLGAYNSKVAGNNNTMNSIFGLGGSLLGNYAGSSAGSAALTKLFGF